MNLPAFKRIWNAHFGKDGQPRREVHPVPKNARKGEPLVDSMSPRTEAALIAASRGDFRAFDRIQSVLDKHDRDSQSHR